MKGAPEVLLRRCNAALGAELNPSAVQSAIEQLASRGMRVLAIADKQLDGDVDRLTSAMVASGMVFVGLEGMIDPPREEAIAAIKACHAAGITVKMITGDHAGTATAIGRQLGLMTEGRAITYGELQAASDDELRTIAISNNVFARVAPEHKLRLVRALQATEQIVAMTGDGVNDAPALKQSNIGVAMGITGTSVSKEAADIVLTDDNFASIAAAVEEGRRVYDNLIKSLAFVLPTNLGLAFILIYAVIFFPFDVASKQLLLPMSPVQLLWINLVAAVSLALPLAFEAKEPDIMNRPPRSPREPVLSRFVVYRTVFAAIFMTAGAIGLFHYEYSTDLADGVDATEALAQAQTMTVTTVIAFQIFYMFNCRSLKGSIFKIGIFSNVTVFIGVGALLVLQGLFIYAPILNGVFGSAHIRPSDLVRALLVGATILPIISVEKWLRGRALRTP
jgi:Ca2+-transporting ATPase